MDTGPAVTVTADNDTGTVFVPPGTKKIFKQNVGTKTGYHGKLKFFDTQLAFDQIFGTQLKIYHTFVSDKDACYAKREITRFAYKCHLDILFFMCRMNYVDTNNNDNTFYVQEFFNDIAPFHQTWRYENGHKIMETPEDLYQKYLIFLLVFHSMILLGLSSCHPFFYQL